MAIGGQVIKMCTRVFIHFEHFGTVVTMENPKMAGFINQYYDRGNSNSMDGIIIDENN